MKTLAELQKTHWIGIAELWVDPLGNTVEHSDCTIVIDDHVVRYTWSQEGQNHEGSITLFENGAEFTDTWHHPKIMDCQHIHSLWGIFQVHGHYGTEPEWGWRLSLCLRPTTDQLILQMTNIAPWGEEARAVRMICSRNE